MDGSFISVIVSPNVPYVKFFKISASDPEIKNYYI